MKIKNYTEFLLEDFADTHPKNKWEDIADEKDMYAKIIMDLINNAYTDAGGNIEGDVLSDPTVNYWQAIDVDEDPDCDAIIYGKNTKFGVKITGMGQDGGKEAKVSVIRKQVEEMKTEGFYCEISGGLVKFLHDAPYVNNKEEVEEVIQKKVEWVGKTDEYPQDGWYWREIHGHRKLKLLVGRPKGATKSDISISK